MNPALSSHNNTETPTADNHESLADEYTPLLRGNGATAKTSAAAPENDLEAANCQSPPSDKQPQLGEENRHVSGVIAILLLGVFIANTDGSLVLATSGTISSEFNDLEAAGWLITSYTLAMCATQSLYGKLSDIYGRKATILTSYVFFAVGCAICGLGQSLPQVVFGRLIAGVGGAGISCLVSIVIADMVPIREVASWRSYVNIAATTGRSLGGPIGGYLTDTIGWRWSFLGQCPPTVLALVLVWMKLKLPAEQGCAKQSHIAKLRRIDFLGAILMSASIVCGLLVLDMGGKGKSWADPALLKLLAAFSVTGSLFLVVEGIWAKEPIFPLRLLINRDVITSYVNLSFQSGAQMAMMMLVPIYFQVSAHASVTNAGAHLMPSVIGNAVGGLLTGSIIRRTGRYKLISVVGAACGLTSYSLMALRWHGHTGFLESLYIVPGGFANGIALSASFIGLTAGVNSGHVAIASSGLYLSSNIGMLVGLSAVSAVLQSTLRKELRVALEGRHGRVKLINKALSDLEFVRSLQGRVGELVTEAYIICLTYTHIVSVGGAIVALLAALCIKEHRL